MKLNELFLRLLLLPSYQVHFLYLFLMTTMTGSIAALLWYIIGRRLENKGFLYAAYTFLKVTCILWLVPVMFIIIFCMDYIGHVWNGIICNDSSPQMLLAARVVAVLWLCGFAVWFGIYLSQQAQIGRTIRLSFECDRCTRELFERCLARKNISGKRIQVRHSYNVSVPCTVRVWRPIILLPADTYSDAELEVIFLHELTHIEHHDLLFKNMFMIINMFHSINPLAYLLAGCYDRWCEYACDYHVCTGNMSLKKYFNVVLKMACEDCAYTPLSAKLCENESYIKERVGHVMKSCNIKGKTKIAAFVLTAGMTLTSLTTAYGASFGTAEVAAEVFRQTQVMIEETKTETEVYVDTDPGRVTEVVFETEEPNPYARDIKSFNWSVAPWTRGLTSGYWVKEGQTITISAVASSSSADIRVGIKTPSAEYHYSPGVGMASFQYKVKKTGYYQIYAENDTDSTVDISGNFNIE